MLESLPGIWSLTPIGGLIGVLIYIGLSIGRGWWVPKTSHERELAAANKRGDEWKETADLRGKLISEQSAQITTLVEATKTPAEFFGTVMRDGGGRSVAETNTPGP